MEYDRGVVVNVSQSSRAVRAGATPNQTVSHHNTGHATHREGCSTGSCHLSECVRGPKVELHLHWDSSQFHSRYHDRYSNFLHKCSISLRQKTSSPSTTYVQISSSLETGFKTKWPSPVNTAFTREMGPSVDIAFDDRWDQRCCGCENISVSTPNLTSGNVRDNKKTSYRSMGSYEFVNEMRRCI